MPAPPRGMPLALAISLALVGKLIVLSLLWHAFFSAPQAKKMRMPTAAVEHRLLAPESPPPAKEYHASH